MGGFIFLLFIVLHSVTGAGAGDLDSKINDSEQKVSAGFAEFFKSMKNECSVQNKNQNGGQKGGEDAQASLLRAMEEQQKLFREKFGGGSEADPHGLGTQQSRPPNPINETAAGLGNGKFTGKIDGDSDSSEGVDGSSSISEISVDPSIVPAGISFPKKKK